MEIINRTVKRSLGATRFISVAAGIRVDQLLDYVKEDGANLGQRWRATRP